MKRFLVSFMFPLLLIHFSSVNAQFNFGYGVRSGINLAWQTTSASGTNVNIKNLLGFNVGGYINYFLFDHLAIQPELIIQRKGSDWSDPSYDVKDQLTYIDLPVLIRYQPVKLLNIHAGPELGYLLSAKQKDNMTNKKIDINSYYKKFDLGLAIGVEANLPFKINFAVRYILGLVPVTTNVQYIDPWKNNFLQISAGYRIAGK